MLGFIIFIIATLFFSLLGFGIVVLVWRYEMHKESKVYDYVIVSNHRKVCIIGIQNIKNSWFGCKIDGNIKGEIPLFGNIIYYNEGTKHIPVLVYYAKQNNEKITLKVYGIKAKQISKSGLFTNRRNNYQIRKLSTDLKEIQFPLIIKPSIHLLLSLAWSLLITIYLFWLVVIAFINREGIIAPFILVIVSGFMIYAQYVSILTFINNRGRLSENGHLYIKNNRYRIKELKYEVKLNHDGHRAITLKDKQDKIILAVTDQFHSFYQLYAYLEDLKQQLQRQALYRDLLMKEYYLPLTETGYVWLNLDDGFHLILFEDIYELEKIEYDHLVGDQLITLEEAIDLTVDFTNAKSVIIKYALPKKDIEITKQMWNEIKMQKNII